MVLNITNTSVVNKEILVETAGRSVIVTLNRPNRKNAITAEMWSNLANIFHAISDEKNAHHVILRGRGSDFCAGADISEFDRQRGTADTARKYEALNEAAFSSIRNCRVPVIAKLSGVCFGGGFGLAAACHFQLADETARFRVPAARLGLAYPAEAVSDIVHGVGVQMARRLLLLAEEVDAAEMREETQFLTGLHVQAKLDEAIELVVEKLAANAPLSIRASQLAIRHAIARDPATLEEAIAVSNQTFESDDYAEGRSAFKQKRAPNFSGR